MFTTLEIRQKFIRYFADQDHVIVPSSSLIPQDDPTLLFTNAGMVQFKKIFQGIEKPVAAQVASVQKCLRAGGKHNDLENVGRTARHHTFFEMLGNFSFGGYFKEKAIQLAWTFLTQELKLPVESLSATVYTEDEEAYNLWHKLTPLPPERIYRIGKKDNFWSMGDTGPCGPCSEIFYDQGESMSCGPNCGIGKCDCDRFLEVWNLVFMQFNQTAPGVYEPLPHPCIDTGMGLERIAAVCQHVQSNFDIDLFNNLIGHIAETAGVKYNHSKPDTNDTDTALRVIADHSRAMAFMIADGIMPSNEGRGYVLRRLIRRAYRFGRLLNIRKAFLHTTAVLVTELMGAQYPELLAAKEFMQQIIKEEENRFERTLDNGLHLLEETMQSLKAKKISIIPGDIAFKLYDTYGFPLDIIHDIAEKQSFKVDDAGFTTCMQHQRELAQAARKNDLVQIPAEQLARIVESGLQSSFTGYTSTEEQTTISALYDNKLLPVTHLAEGQTGLAILATTPFYAASGGQSGESGLISWDGGQAKVLDTTATNTDLSLHKIKIDSGILKPNLAVTAKVDCDKRKASARNHTATHLLHAALQKVLGSHARQAGSLVNPERLRFDVTHISTISSEELQKLSYEVNAAILADLPVKTTEMPYEQAINKGATALFGEKYEENVRVVNIDPISAELCGGIHVCSTGEIGAFVIIGESGVAAGIRRIEAATGWNALQYYENQKKELHESQQVLKAAPGDTVTRIQSLQQELRTLRKELETTIARTTSSQNENIMERCETINGIKVLAFRSGAPNMKALRDMADNLRSKIPSGIICLTTEENGKVSLILIVSKDLHSIYTAPQLVKQIAAAINGSGGGRPDMAQAGGTNPDGIDTAFTQLKQIIAG